MSVDRVIAIQDRERHNRPIYAYKICKVFVLCSVIGGKFRPNIETVGSGYFALDELPALSQDKTTTEQVEMCFEAYHATHWETLIE